MPQGFPVRMELGYAEKEPQGRDCSYLFSLADGELGSTYRFSTDNATLSMTLAVTTFTSKVIHRYLDSIAMINYTVQEWGNMGPMGSALDIEADGVHVPRMYLVQTRLVPWEFSVCTPPPSSGGG